MSKIIVSNFVPKIKMQTAKPQRIKSCKENVGKSEKDIEREICRYLDMNRITYWQIKIKGDPTLTAKGIVFKKNKNVGFSDILVCHKGKMICLEVKRHGGVCSTYQLEMQQRVRFAGGTYEFVSSIEQVNIILRK